MDINMDKIRDKIDNDEYKTKQEFVNTPTYREHHIFDENKSVKWNRDERIKRNEETKENIRDYRLSQQEAEQKFQEDIIELIVADYRFSEKEDKTRDIANRIYYKAYQERHSSGMTEVLYESMEIADFVETLFNI